VILKVGNQQVRREDFESGIGNFEGEKQGLAEKDRRKLGDDYASVLMLSQKALEQHLDSTPEVVRELAIDRLQTLSNAEFESLKRQSEPKPEEIRQYYSAHLSDYDEVQIRRLFIWKRHGDSKVGAGFGSQEARAHADAILRASSAGSDANKLAEELKDSKGALLDTTPSIFPRGELPAHMEKVAFAMKQGEWSEVEDTPDRILLITLVKRDRKQLGQASSLIEQELRGQKMEALLDEMKKNAGIWMDEKYFGTVAPVSGAQLNGSSPSPQLGKSDKTQQGEKRDDR
jgi:parvulin-like peptidyl-prolyl isomerase